MKRREDNIKKMLLPDRHTGGQTDIGRSCSYALQCFAGKAIKWHWVTLSVYCIQGKSRPRFIFALFALWPEGEFKIWLIALYTSRVILENWGVGEFKTGRISFRTLLGQNKTGRIQSCIQKYACTELMQYIHTLLKRCTQNGSFACEVRYLTPIVYGHFIMTIARVKRPYTIAIKYLFMHANLPCPSWKLHLLRTPF